MIKTLNDPGLLTRILAVYILFVLFTGAAVVAILATVQHAPIPDAISALLSAAFGLALHNIGLSQGIKLTNGDTANVLKQLANNQQGGNT